MYLKQLTHSIFAFIVIALVAFLPASAKELDVIIG